MLIIAIFSFYFINLQRELLSRSNFEFDILKTFYKDALERDAEKGIFLVRTILSYRKNFVIPQSSLDNCLISLNESILSNNEVKRKLSGPEHKQLIKDLYNDKSPIIAKIIKTKDEIFGPLEGLNEEQIEEWRKNNLVKINLPFKIPLAWDQKTIVTQIIVNKKAEKYFLSVFNEIKDRGLENKLTEFAGTYGYRPKKYGQRLSAHSYGIAIDLNLTDNRIGTKGKIDPQVVAIFKQNGFAWGGDWSIQDPMHFELLPSAVSEEQYVIN